MLDDALLMKMVDLATWVAGLLSMMLPVLLLVWFMWLFAGLHRDADAETQRGFRRASAVTFGVVFAVCGLMLFALYHSRPLS